MSVEASIDLRIVRYATGAIVSPIEIVKILASCGWSFVNPEGYVYYLPVGDNDMFDWKDGKMDIPSLIKILEEKELENELIGVGMRWQNTEIGGEILLWPERKMAEKKIHTSMSFCLDGSRQVLSCEGYQKITDVNWYLTKLLPIFNQGDTLVEYYTYEEHV